MGKKSLLGFVLFLLLFGLVNATPDVNVVYPNGGETLWGRQNFDFIVSEPANAQTLNASLYYSSSPGNRTNLIETIGLLNGNYCTPDYNKEEMWGFVGGDYSETKILPIYNTPLWIGYWKNGEFDGNLLWFGKAQNGAYGSECYYTYTSGYVNTETGELVRTDFLGNQYRGVPPYKQCWSAWDIYHHYPSFFYQPQATVPSMGWTCFIRSGVNNYTSTYRIRVADWNGSSFSNICFDLHSPYPDDIRGTCICNEEQGEIFDWFDYVWEQHSSTYIIVTGNIQRPNGVATKVTYTTPFTWDGSYWMVGKWTDAKTGGGDANIFGDFWHGYRYLGDGNWTEDNSLVDENTNLSNLITDWVSGGVKPWNGTLYFFGIDEFENSVALSWNDSNRQWQKIQDFNKGIGAAQWAMLNDYTWRSKHYATYNDDIYLFQLKTKYGVQGSDPCRWDYCSSYTTWKHDEEMWNTENQRTCSYNWNASHQGTWYLDINVSNGTQTAQDSSDENFTVYNNCSDGIKNGDEQGVDCGSTCQPCSEKYGACVPVVKNGDTSDKIDVVFVGSGFPDLNKFDEVVDEMIDYDGDYYGLMSVEPFKTRKNEFNFWKVSTIQTFSSGYCFPVVNFWVPTYSHEGEDLALKDCPFEFDKVMSLFVTPKVRNGTIMIRPTKLSPPLSLDQSFVTIGEEYLYDTNWPIEIKDTDCSDKTSENAKYQVQRAVIHEFGHNIGALWDEYGETGWGTAWHVPNCDSNGLFGEPACTKWDSIAPDHNCIPKCYSNSWYRPYEASLMYDHTWGYDFMPVNEYFLEQAILKFVGLPKIQSNFSYKVDLNYSKGAIAGSHVELVAKKASNKYLLDANGFNLMVLNSGNEILNDFNFNFPLYIRYSPLPSWFDENGSQIFFPEEQSLTLTDANITLLVPYENGGKTVNLYDENSNYIKSIDISNLKPIKYTIGVGGNKISNTDINVNYSLTPSPVKKLYGTDYNIFIGPQFFWNN